MTRWRMLTGMMQSLSTVLKTDRGWPTSYDDIPKFYVYQSYDNFNHPNELIAPEFFAPDNTQFYAKVAAALKTKPTTGLTIAIDTPKASLS